MNAMQKCDKKRAELSTHQKNCLYMYKYHTIKMDDDPHIRECFTTHFSSILAQFYVHIHYLDSLVFVFFFREFSSS